VKIPPTQQAVITEEIVTIKDLYGQWFLIVLLFLGSLILFIPMLDSIYLRYQFTHNSAVGSLESAPGVLAPHDWYENEGDVPTAMFDVKIKMADGEVSFEHLYMSKTAIDRLLAGQTLQIRYLKDNRRNYIETTEGLPSIRYRWAILGAVLFMAFCYTLKYRPYRLAST